MNLVRRRACKLMYSGLLLALLLALATTWAAAAANQPITMKTTWSFSETSDVDDLPGLWFAGVDSNNPSKHVFGLAWIPDASAWWPTWRLVVASDYGLLPVDPQKATTVPGWNTGAGLSLATSKPVTGHVYEPLLSYDPQTGALSVALTDKTAGERIFTGGFSVPKSIAPFTAASKQLDNTTPAADQVTIGKFEVSSLYIPMDTRWQISEIDESALISVSMLDPGQTAYLQVSTEGQVPSGQYRLIYEHNGVRTTLPVQPKVNDKVLFPLDNIALGKSQLTLEYLEQGQVTYSDTRSFTLGSADVSFGNVKVDRTAKTVNSTVQIRSKHPFSGINVAVEATITEMNWDAASKTYKEEVYKQETFSLATNLALPGDGQPVTLPVQMPMPDRPNFWKLSLKPIVTPNISVATFAKPVMFNTYTRAEAGPPAGEPYTISVIPDIQYFVKENPTMLYRISQWLLENADAKNIGLVLQMGDLTDNNTPEQWERTQAGLTQLDGLIPYAVTLGNHDMAPPGRVGAVAHRGETLFMNYFNKDSFSGLQGSFPEGKLYNTFHTFNIAGIDYLVIALEFAPPNEAVEWANKVVEAHPNHKVILITHEYVQPNGLRAPTGKASSYALAQDTTTTMNDGEDLWYKLVRKHPNFFLVFSGHFGATNIPYHVDKGQYGNTVYEFLVDYQDHTDGWFANFEFTPDNKINVSVYSPYLGKLRTDFGKYGYSNQYQLDMNTGRITYK